MLASIDGRVSCIHLNSIMQMRFRNSSNLSCLCDRSYSIDVITRPRLILILLKLTVIFFFSDSCSDPNSFIPALSRAVLFSTTLDCERIVSKRNCRIIYSSLPHINSAAPSDYKTTTRRLNLFITRTHRHFDLQHRTHTLLERWKGLSLIWETT